jgi:hypothetical protein
MKSNCNMSRWILLFVVVLLTACESDMAEMEALGSNSGIVGTWVEDTLRGDTLLFQRARKLDEVKYGFTIVDDGTFLERKNAGWCATPPITYENFEGTWEAVSDSLLDIKVAYWGGMMTFQIRIISLEEEKLAIKYLYTDAREDAR